MSGDGGGGDLGKAFDFLNPFNGDPLAKRFRNIGVDTGPDINLAHIDGHPANGGAVSVPSGPPTTKQQQDFENQVKNDPNIDEQARADILKGIADPNYADNLPKLIAQYNQALDYKNPATADRRRRVAAAKILNDTPGLSAQTRIEKKPFSGYQK